MLIPTQKLSFFVLLSTLLCDAVSSQSPWWCFWSGCREESGGVSDGEETSAPSCPPTGFDAKKDVDLASFVSARWYSIKQKEVFYQPENEAFCVFAEYGIDTSGFCPLCGSKPRISVFNRSQRDSVTGEVNSIEFGAFFPDATNNPGKAFVAPRFIANTIGRFPRLTNYWVIDAGTDTDILAGTTPSTGTTYEWAIITAGAVDEAGTNGKCTAGGGQWLFHRNPEPDSNVVAAIEARAESLGIDTNQWIPVQQAGCTY